MIVAQPTASARRRSKSADISEYLRRQTARGAAKSTIRPASRPRRCRSTRTTSRSRCRSVRRKAAKRAAASIAVEYRRSRRTAHREDARSAARLHPHQPRRRRRSSRARARTSARGSATARSRPTALLRLGQPAEVREFSSGTRRPVSPNGYVPCCVSTRGRRSRAGARQPRPVHLPRRRVLPPHARSRARRGDVAASCSASSRSSTSCATSA